MPSSISTFFVRPSRAVTMIIPWLTSNRPDMRFPLASWKLICSLILVPQSLKTVAVEIIAMHARLRMTLAAAMRGNSARSSWAFDGP
jgi:heme/copper-type cytochrome/quinol oxidase subunit 1